MSSILIGASILFLLASPARADRKTEEILMVVGAGADLISTEVALSRGLEEWHPLGQKRWQRIAIKSVSVVSVTYLARKLEKHGHDRWARVLRYAHIGVGFGAASWNTHVTIRWGN